MAQVRVQPPDRPVFRLAPDFARHVWRYKVPHRLRAAALSLRRVQYARSMRAQRCMKLESRQPKCKLVPRRCFPQPLGLRQTSGFITAREDDQKLLAAIAAYGVVRAYVAAKTT